MSQDAVERVLGRLINDDGNSKAIKDSLADSKRGGSKSGGSCSGRKFGCYEITKCEYMKGVPYVSLKYRQFI